MEHVFFSALQVYLGDKMIMNIDFDFIYDYS